VSFLGLLEMKVVDAHDRKDLAFRSNPTVPGLSSRENSTAGSKLHRVRRRFDECSGVHAQASIVRSKGDCAQEPIAPPRRLATYAVIRNPRLPVAAKELFPCGLKDESAMPLEGLTRALQARFPTASLSSESGNSRVGHIMNPASRLTFVQPLRDPPSSGLVN
jgi:hypothetical protein